MVRVINFLRHKQVINREYKNWPAGDPKTWGH